MPLIAAIRHFANKRQLLFDRLLLAFGLRLSLAAMPLLPLFYIVFRFTPFLRLIIFFFFDISPYLRHAF